jgi:rubrerythrin
MNARASIPISEVDSMDNSTKRMIDGLQRAIQAEHEGRHFYLMAAGNTNDLQGREIFQNLAEEELSHFHYLQAQYKSLLETGKVDSSVSLGKSKILSGSHPIFSEAIKERINQAHYEMTALSIGIQLEQSAVRFYSTEAETVVDPAVASFYGELAEWERGHLKALQSQMESLREDYWNKGGFAPF